MFNRNKTIYLLLMLFFSISLSACSELKTIDSKIGSLLGVDQEELASDEPAPKQATSTPILSKEQKERIDLWLESNGYNRYGDSAKAYYASGTPLFDEKTGKTRERYDYILEKHPDVLSKI